MPSIKDRFAHIPEGAGALFFIQIFATLGFAVIYFTLDLYATKHLHFSTAEAAAITGVFGAFNYGLHLFGGYLGGRFMSNRNLFIGGMVLQFFGSACLSLGTAESLYVGLALFLTGSGLNVTCLNMMLTQRFAPEDNRREGAFLWNYAGMNVGFLVGFIVAGYFQDHEDYANMYRFATVGNFSAIVIAFINWRVIRDLSTPLLQKTREQFNMRFIVGTLIMLALVPALWIALQHTSITRYVVKGISAFVAVTLLYLAATHRDKREQNNMWAYLILALGSLVFWTLYQLTPSALQQFADNNVRLAVGNFKIAPVWVQNINTVVLVFGGPLMSALFVKLRARGWNIDVPRQFSVSLILMGIGTLALPLGISLADSSGKVDFIWLFTFYVFQSFGELFISPVGYAMVGRLAPQKYQGIMMGAWMLQTGLASVFATDLASLIPEPTVGSAAQSTNPAYSALCTELGWGTIGVGVVLILLIPFLGRLIKDATKPAPEIDAKPVAA
ncbi:MAG TPA: oligopeptide:H+ symporter [Burkholderiaceae bacterium]